MRPRLRQGQPLLTHQEEKLKSWIIGDAAGEMGTHGHREQWGVCVCVCAFMRTDVYVGSGVYVCRCVCVCIHVHRCAVG